MEKEEHNNFPGRTLVMVADDLDTKLNYRYIQSVLISQQMS